MRDDARYRTRDEPQQRPSAAAEPVDLLTLPFDQYQRYNTVAEIAGSVKAYLGKAHLRVLDVGGLHRTRDGYPMLPLVHFLPGDRVAATDLAQSSLPGYLRATGAALPFRTEAFEMVITCDTLEHVPPANRAAFVNELLRVASHCVVLTAPVQSEPTLRAEAILRAHQDAAFGRVQRQLEEHFEQGLPSIDDLRALLAESGLVAVEFADGYLPHWLAMIMIQMDPEIPSALLAQLNRFYNRHFSPHDRREPAYRQTFAIAKWGHEDLLPAVSRAVHPRPIASFPRPDFAHDMDALLHQVRREGPVRLAYLEAENARLRQVLEGYEQGRFIRFMRWLHGRSNLLRRGHNER